ncbi:GNAT family N-acetyltransferase [Halomicrobium salinisoli]|uniref:GNAT family N-acetyltransferase n=1 Tax=Halomicrobium salinisoli TaxID=2878391 RepID=UPI001CF026A8|nr:GNAT family protein [Halomicrobium salinisoli]
MPGHAFLRGDRVTLRTVTDEDHAFLAEHWNRPTIRRYTHSHDPITEAELRESDGEFDVGTLICRDGEPVGFAWAFDVNDVAGNGEIGYWIAAEERGQGYATEAVDLLCEWAFLDRQLEKLLARVFDGNDASMRVLEKVGFQREGRLREHYKVEGERVDAVLFGLLAEEWREEPPE